MDDCKHALAKKFGKTSRGDQRYQCCYCGKTWRVCQKFHPRGQYKLRDAPYPKRPDQHKPPQTKQDRRASRLRDAGLCPICAKPAEGFYLCQSCRIKKRDRRRERAVDRLKYLERELLAVPAKAPEQGFGIDLLADEELRYLELRRMKSNLK